MKKIKNYKVSVDFDDTIKYFKLAATSKAEAAELIMKKLDCPRWAIIKIIILEPIKW